MEAWYKWLRCRCGCGKGQADSRLVEGIAKLDELVHEKYGVHLRCNSGYRCPKHNAAVGGAKGSKHCLGQAADLSATGVPITGLVSLAESVPEFRSGGIGAYIQENFVHVDVRDRASRWGRLKRGGPYVSFEAAMGRKPAVSATGATRPTEADAAKADALDSEIVAFIETVV